MIGLENECITQSDISENTMESTADAAIIVSPTPEPFTVTFEENETFLTEAERKASERIDSSIRKAVELLNTIDDESILISDCDYETRPKERDSLKDPHSKDIYDHILAEDYRDGRDQYLFMTQEDFDYYGYVQESCQ